MRKFSSQSLPECCSWTSFILTDVVFELVQKSLNFPLMSCLGTVSDEMEASAAIHHDLKEAYVDMSMDV